MKILLKRMVIGLFLFFCASIIFTGLYHYYMLMKEKEWLKPTGHLVNVNNTNLHVYSENNDEGNSTLVFMSGAGVAAPQYEFKALSERFISQYNIAIVDRAGYGYSDLTEEQRTLENIVEQTRLSLLKSNINPPYILIPHSISGLEALYWAQLYPDEIEAIIGLDIGLPDEYIKYDIKAVNKLMLSGYQFITKVGIHRLFPSLAYNEAVITKGNLTSSETKAFKAISYKQSFNKNMREEILLAKSNSMLINSISLPQHIPLLLIDAYINKDAPAAIENYNRYIAFAEQFEHSEVIQLQSTHSLYLHVPEDIYQYTVQFLNETINR